MSNLKTLIIFITVVILIYGSANFYLYRRTMQAASPSDSWVWVLRALLIIAILSYPLGRILGSGNSMGVFLIWMGSFYLAVMTYGVMIALIVDIVRLIDLPTGWLPRWMIANPLQTGRMIFAGSVVIITFLLVGGHVRSLYPTMPEYTIELDKFSEDRDEYRIVMLADLHLGVIVGEKRLTRIVEQINELSPDLVLIAGDLIDESADGMPWMIEPLSGIESTDGVYAVTGNHEVYAGVSEFEALIQKAGVRVLRNEIATIKVLLPWSGWTIRGMGGKSRRRLQ